MSAPRILDIADPGPAITPNSPEAAGHHPVPESDPELVLPTEEPELLALGNRMLAELADVVAERAANAAAERLTLEEIRNRYRVLDEPLARRYAQLTAVLEAIHHQLPQRGKAKSRKLANGTIGTRIKPARVEVTDTEAAIAAVKELGLDDATLALLVRPVTTEKLDHRSLTSFVAAHGWGHLPGTEVHPAVENFYADPLPPVAQGGAR